MAGPFYNNIKGTTAGTAGTGAFTPNAAATGALAWSTVPVGWIGLVRFEDGSAWEMQYSYWNGTTLSRNETAGALNQFVNSSSGSGLTLTSAATAELVADGSEIAPHLAVPWAAYLPQVDSTSFNSFGVPGWTTTGTPVAVSVSSGGILSEAMRTRYTSATTANAQAGLTVTATSVLAVISTTAGRGGFEFVARFGASQLPTGNRIFIGMTSATLVGVTAEPSALTAHYSTFAKDSTDTNIQLLTNSNAGAGTKINTGIPLVANGWYEGIIWTAPGSTAVSAMLIRLDTGAIYYGSTSSDVPANNAALFAQSLMGLSSTTGTAVALHQGSIVIRPGAG